MKGNTIRNDIKTIHTTCNTKRRQPLQMTVLEESDTIFKKMWESSLSGIYISQDGVFKTISPLAASFIGYKTEELIGKRSDSLIFSEDRKNVKRNARATLNGKRLTPYEFRIVGKQKNICWVMETVTYVLFRGKPAILGNFVDITERKTVENKLQESENLYRTVFETTGAATVIIEEDMTVAIINSEFEKMTGYRKEEWEGKRKWTEYIAPKDITRMVKTHVLRRVNAKAAPKTFEHDLIDSQGRIRHMVVMVDMIPGTKRSVSSFFDITAWKEAEQGLKKRKQELKIKSRNLEELNTALRVLLKQREKDKEELENMVLSNVKELVFPYIHKIRKSRLDAKAITYVNILESNLKDIISPFSHKLSSKYMNLTPKEIQIASLIKEGKTSKEIADIMNLSKSAVDIHRYRLRSKLGLNNRKANLIFHLTNFS